MTTTTSHLHAGAGRFTLDNPFWDNFLGNAPDWYKLVILCFLLVNPLTLVVAGPFVAGWLLVGEFIFTLAMALKCYPCNPAGCWPSRQS